jgi:hypothetical protein
MPSRTYSIVSAYRNGEIIAQVGGTEIGYDDSLSIFFPKAHDYRVGDAVTVHLDDRTGVEEFDLNLHVYRTSYKGIVSAANPERIVIRPVHYQLFWGTRIVAEFSSPGYRFPTDTRPESALPAIDPRKAFLPDEKERENKLGVWITHAEDRPHTTVMAFLSSTQDDIFLISHSGTFKSACIRRDRRCFFAIDHRANFVFEKAIDWNFTIIRAEADLIPRGTPLFADIQAQFVRKNPWELPFFTDPKVELFHLTPLSLVCNGDRIGKVL